MRSRLRTMALAGVVALGTLHWAGAGVARAQVYLSTPGFSLGLGAPSLYPAPVYAPPVYLGGGYPGYAPVIGVYPVRPYPYIVGRPAYYGPRPYYYAPYGHGYRRW